MYDVRNKVIQAFRKIDVNVEISIPGSLEIKAYSLNGQPVKVTEKEYESVYYSSILLLHDIVQ